MAKIPDISSIGLQSLEPSRNIGEYRAGLEQDAAAEGDAQYTQAEGQAFGTLAKGVQSAGTEIADAQDNINFAASYGQFLQKKLQLDQQFQSDPDYTTAPQRYSAAIQQAAQDSSKGIASSELRSQFMSRVARMQEFGMDAMVRQAHAKSVQADRDWLNSYVQGATDGALRAGDEATRTQFLDSANAVISAMATKGSITASEAQTARRGMAENYAVARARLLAPGQLAAMVAKAGGNGEVIPKTGTWLDMIPPQQLAQLIDGDVQRAKTQQLAAEVEQERQFRLQQQAQEQASKADEAKAISDLTGPNAGNITAQQIGDPNGPYKNLTPSARLTMLDLAKRSSVGSTDATLGPGFMPLLKRIYADQSDPTRITDAKDLVPYINSTDQPPITVAGFTRLQSELGHAGKPDTQAENAMKSAFLANAKAQITGSNQGLGLRDPKGDTLYLQFLGHFFDAYDKAKASGKTPGQLLSPDSPDYLGKSIGQFKRPMSQWASDMLQDNGPGGNAAGEVDLSSMQGIVSAYHSGKISRADAAQALVKGGFASASPQPPAVPLAR